MSNFLDDLLPLRSRKFGTLGPLPVLTLLTGCHTYKRLPVAFEIPTLIFPPLEVAP